MAITGSYIPLCSKLPFYKSIYVGFLLSRNIRRFALACKAGKKIVISGGASIASAAAIYFTVLSFTHSESRTNWIEGLLYMNACDREAILKLLDIDSMEFQNFMALEARFSGATRLYTQAKGVVGSTDSQAITIFLAINDARLASEFADYSRFARGKSRIIHIKNTIFPPIMIYIASFITARIARPSSGETRPRKILLNALQYFLTYYFYITVIAFLFEECLLRLLQSDFIPLEDVVALDLILDSVLIAALVVQYIYFIKNVQGSTYTRVLIAAGLSFCVTISIDLAIPYSLAAAAKCSACRQAVSTLG